MSGTVTFLFSDIEGSTALLRRLGRDEYERALAQHEEILSEAVAAHGGRVVDMQGDSFFVAFRAARDAILAAVEAQRGLAAAEWPDGVALNVRMGLHSGEPKASGDRYVGIGVHRAARVGGAAHGGQMLLSETTRALVEDDLPAGLTLRDLGPVRLKDIERPERISQLTAEGLPAGFPPLHARRARRQPLPSRRSALAGALVGVVAAAVAIPVFELGGGGSTVSAAVQPNAVGAIDASGRVTSVPLGGVSPNQVAIGQRAVWVTGTNSDSVVEVDPKTHTPEQTITVGNGPVGIVVCGRFVWVANSLEGTVSQIDRRSQKEVNRLQVGNGPTAVACGDGSLWVANSGDRTVSRIDPNTGSKTHTYQTPAGADAIAVGANALWVVSEADGTVARIDPQSGTAQSINVGNGPTAIAVVPGAVWVANGIDGTVMRIDPRSDKLTALVRVGALPTAIAIGAGFVWVSNERSGALTKIDPATNKPVRVKTGSRPEGIAANATAVYVAVQASAVAHRGGTLRVAAVAGECASEAECIDPANATASYSHVTLLTNDGLVAYKHVAGLGAEQLVPDLAIRLPTVSDGGTTYTFQLRRDIQYSSGVVVRPADIRRGIERSLVVVDPGGEPDGLGSYFYEGIVGARGCRPNSARCDLSKGIQTDPVANTVTFHLTAPDPDFVYKLALPCGYAVPASTPLLKPHLPLPATGPYEVADFDLEHGFKLVPNPRFRQWSADAQPAGLPASIVFKFGGTPESETHAVEQGNADVAFDGPAQSLVDEVTTNYASQTHSNPSLATDYFVLNTGRRPFDNLQARRAVSFAVNRTKLVALRGLPVYSRPTCQLLPPGLPGYKRYCPYILDLAKAKALVAASGTIGDRVTVLAFATKEHVSPIYRYFVRALNSIGYKARLTLVKGKQNPYHLVGNSTTAPQASGVAGWTADYPSPREFLSLLSCASFTRGSSNNVNLAEFCNNRIDDEIKSASALQASDFHAASRRWTKIDHDLTDLAPLVSFANDRHIDFVSRRVGNYTYDIVWSIPLLDQMWVS